MKKIKSDVPILLPYIEGSTKAIELMVDEITKLSSYSEKDREYISNEYKKILEKKAKIMEYYKECTEDMNMQLKMYKLNKVAIDKYYDELVGIEEDMVKFLRGVAHTQNKIRQNATYGLWGMRK